MEWRILMREKERRKNKAFEAFFPGCDTTFVHVDYLGKILSGKLTYGRTYGILLAAMSASV